MRHLGVQSKEYGAEHAALGNSGVQWKMCGSLNKLFGACLSGMSSIYQQGMILRLRIYVPVFESVEIGGRDVLILKINFKTS